MKQLFCYVLQVTPTFRLPRRGMGVDEFMEWTKERKEHCGRGIDISAEVQDINWEIEVGTYFFDVTMEAVTKGEVLTTITHRHSKKTAKLPDGMKIRAQDVSEI
eukprot:10753807-Lingulodinium_polyedra.AAC.1